MTDLWEDLVTTALVGTERRAPALTPPPGPLGALIGQLDLADRERALLAAAALIVQYRQAGRQIERSEVAAPPPCPPERLPRCRPAAAARVQLMLRGPRSDLLPEWLAAAAAAGQRAPEMALPGLLEHGRRLEDDRDLILPVLGECGRWLAAQNPDWAWATAETADPDTIWRLGARDARLALLRRLRAGDPGRARDLLAGTLKQESAADRAAFFKTFATSLSLADEPLLEAALDDRRKEVRVIAADLLASLPGSALLARTIARVEPLLAFTPAQPARLFPPARPRPARLDVTLPGDDDPALLRDTIQRDASIRLGDRALRLYQMLAVIPPGHWTARWRTTPVELLVLTLKHEWEKALVEGWTAATLRHRDAEWAGALLQRDPRQHALLPLLPPARLEALALPLLKASVCPLCANHPLLTGLIEMETTWSPTLSRAMIRLAQRHIAEHDQKQTTDRFHYTVNQFGRYAYRVPPALAGELAQGWPELKEQPVLRSRVNDFLAVLRDRATIHKEIAS